MATTHTFLLCFLLSALNAELRLNGVFSNHTVLQQPVPELGITSTRIFGMAALDETVLIQGSSGFPGPFKVLPNKTSNLVPGYGNFSVEIIPKQNDASYPGPYTITIQTYQTSNPSNITNTTTLYDIYFGDVILCSGQSNMELNVDQCANTEWEKSQANNLPNIRLLNPTHSYSNYTLQNLTTENNLGWRVASNTTIGGFSCVCWMNGRLLSDYLFNKTGTKQYLGLIESDIGGTSVHFWAPGIVGQACNTTGLLPSTGECANPGPPYYAFPGSIFNAMINPISMYQKGLSIRLAMWYQGEADSGENDHMSQEAYECELNGLIRGWREQFGIPNLPFIIIQLPSGGVAPYYNPAKDTGDQFVAWPGIQSAQNEVFKMNSMIGMVTAQDQGQGSLHYPFKQIVAYRANLWTRSLAYGDMTVNPQGPKLEQIYKLNGADLKIYLNFSNVVDGIKLQEAVNCTKLAPVEVYTDTNHSYRCCDGSGVNIIRVKLQGIFWVDRQGHDYPQLWNWMPTNVTVVNKNTVMAQVLLPETPGIDWPSGGDKWIRTQTVAIKKVTVGNNVGCVIANSNGIPLAASGGPYDVEIIGENNDGRKSGWDDVKKLDL